VLVLITYDVNTETPAGKRRLYKVAKQCKNYGQRVQYSVFECLIEPAQMVVLKNTLGSLIDEDTDSLRFYYLGDHWQGRVEHLGAKPSIDLEGTLIV
jgi:CRISPR-associated protein Cas2